MKTDSALPPSPYLVIIALCSALGSWMWVSISNGGEAVFKMSLGVMIATILAGMLRPLRPSLILAAVLFGFPTLGMLALVTISRVPIVFFLTILLVITMLFDRDSNDLTLRQIAGIITVSVLFAGWQFGQNYTMLDSVTYVETPFPASHLEIVTIEEVTSDLPYHGHISERVYLNRHAGWGAKAGAALKVDGGTIIPLIDRCGFFYYPCFERVLFYANGETKTLSRQLASQLFPDIPLVPKSLRKNWLRAYQWKQSNYLVTGWRGKIGYARTENGLEVFSGNENFYTSSSATSVQNVVNITPLEIDYSAIDDELKEMGYANSTFKTLNSVVKNGKIYTVAYIHGRQEVPILNDDTLVVFGSGGIEFITYDYEDVSRWIVNKPVLHTPLVPDPIEELQRSIDQMQEQLDKLKEAESK